MSVRLSLYSARSVSPPALNIPWEDLKTAVEIIAEEAEKAL